MLIQIAAALALLALLWALARFALGLRFAKAERERSRAAQEAQGRRVVAEVPLSEGEVVFFLEEEGRFLWGGEAVAKPEIAGGRLLVNGAVVKEFARAGAALPPPPPAEEFEGRERWEVLVYKSAGPAVRVPCGSFREGISREIGTRVFEAVRKAGGGR